MTNKWQQAQKKESESWMETDMSYDYLINNWKSRAYDFRYITEKLNDESEILDVGCGPVPVLHVFPKCKRMVALDSLNNQYETKYERLDHIEYISEKAEKLDYQDESFDAILCVNALDHMDDYENTLKEMARCLKSGGRLYMEYENTSPLSILLSKIGYKKPLNDFHPILVQNKKVIEILKKENMKVLRIKCRAQFSFKKIWSIIQIIIGKKKVSSYEQKISAVNYGLSRALFHYLVIFIERLLFSFFPVRFGYFTSIIASKK